jgi:hypothetical protein
MSWRRFAAPVTVSAALLLGLAGLIAACQPASRTSQPATQSSRPAQTLPIRVEEIRQTADDQPIRGWVAKIDLADPRVAVRVTGPIERRSDDPPGIEARTQTTLDWLKHEGLVLAVNTHFFARLDDGKGPVPTSAPVDLIGPCVSAGRVVSPGRGDGRRSPVLALTRERRARIAMLTSGELDGLDDVVSGLAETGGRSGGLLVEHSANTGATALPRSLERHPRTAAGLTADGRTLILVVIDGRQPAWSIGLTLLELADLMLKLGAESAVNLDGGGSSSFIFAPPDGPQVTNRPSDGRWRPVGASLGVYVKPQP